MHLVIFEGSYWPTFAPLSLSRPVFCLMSGASTLVEKAVRHVRPDRVTLWVRKEFEEYCRRLVAPLLKVPVSINTPLDDEPALLMSGRAMHMSRYEQSDEPSVVLDEGDIVRSAYVRVPGLTPEDAMKRTDRWMQILKLPQAMPQTRLPQHVWDLLNWNEEAIVTDAVHQPGSAHPMPSGPYHAIDWENIWLGANVNLAPGCVLDASKGPIIVGEGVSIGANSVITGPCYIGSFAVVFPLSHIRGGTSIGHACRVGGEIGNSIILPFSAKQHYGYLGDSYVGEWVNLGAGTTTSNLKNTLGEVSIPMGGNEVKTGRRMLGAIIGDHTKTAIGTRLNTGTYAGYCSMIGASHIAPRYIKSLQWITDDGIGPYRPEKAAEVIKMAMSRRHKQWSEVEQTVFDYAAKNAATIEA